MHENKTTQENYLPTLHRGGGGDIMTDNQARLLAQYAEITYRLINHVTVVVNDYPEEKIIEEQIKLDEINQLAGKL